MFEQFWSLGLATVASLLPIANPFSTAPIFLSLTRTMTPQEQRRIARRTTLYLFFILTACFLAGTLIMRFFGISIPGLRIAGRVLIIKFGLGSMGARAAIRARAPRASALGTSRFLHLRCRVSAALAPSRRR